jgi:hypothetical protein
LPYTEPAAYRDGSLRPSRLEASQEIGQSKQIGHSKQGPSGGDRQEGIRLDDARPRRRHAPQPPLLIVETDPVLSPGLVPGDQFELAAVLRVEGMGDPDDLLRYVRITCN